MKTPIIILHGWGLRGSVYRKIIDLLHKRGHDVYAFDLPGFGKEPLRKQGRVRLRGEAEDKRGDGDKEISLDLDDYVNFVHQFVLQKKIKKVVIIGHSFGGRIALKYENMHREYVSKLILTGVPIIRRMSFAKRILFYLTVTLGIMFRLLPQAVERFLRKALYFGIGEWDYYNAGTLKQTFKNIIDEDLKEYARKVEVPTLLLWGEDDKLTPVGDVAEIKKLITHAQTVVVPNVGHKLPYERPMAFYNGLQEIL